MIKKSILGVFLLTAIMALPSCDGNMVFHDFERIENGIWRWDDPVDFSFYMDDTTSLHDIQVQLRHSTEYPLSNLHMFVHITGPSGQAITDTINFILAENSGKWIGKGVGNIRAIGYLYRKNTVFPDTGYYHVSIEQAMRLPEVPVKEIGLRVSKANP